MLNTITETGRLATTVRDRVDMLLLGRGRAARHRVLRLLDRAKARRYRGRCYRALPIQPWLADPLPAERRGRVDATRARAAALLAG